MCKGLLGSAQGEKSEAFVVTINPTIAPVDFFYTNPVNDYQLIGGPGAPGPMLAHTTIAGITNAVMSVCRFNTHVANPIPAAPKKTRVVHTTATTVTMSFYSDTQDPKYNYTVNE